MSEEIEYYQRQHMALSEMLAHALETAGGEVRIKKDDLQSGKFDGRAISIEEDLRTEEWVVTLKDVPEAPSE